MLPGLILYNYNIAQAAINNTMRGIFGSFWNDKPPIYSNNTETGPLDANRLITSQNYDMWSGNKKPEPKYNPVDYAQHASIYLEPSLKGFSNDVNYDINLLTELGNDWKKSVNRANGTELNADNLALFAPTALDFAGSVYNRFQYDKTPSDLSADAGYGRSSVMGVGYTTQNLANVDLVMKEEHTGNVSNTLSNMAKGAAAGSAFGWIGAAGGAAVGLFSGLLGGGSRHAAARRALEELRLLANRTNTFNRNMAMTTGIQQDFSKKYGNQEGLVLFAKHGADSNEGGTWAKTQFGETKDSDGKLTTYTTGTPGVDSNLDYIKDDDTIFSLETPIGHIMTQLSAKVNRNTGKNLEIANRVARKSVELAKEGQKELRNLGYLPEEQYGMAKWGIDDWGNLAQSLSGIGTAFGGFLLAKNSAIHRPDIRVADDSQRYINDLYSLRPDNLSIFRELRNSEARGRYQLASAGGLRGGQIPLAGIALTNNTQNSIAQAMAQAQDRFNALRSQAATAGINATNARTQRDMAALQYNDQMYQYAASAKQNLMRDYLAQIPAMIGTYAKGAATSRRHQDMMNLYYLQNAIDAERYGLSPEFKQKYGLV